MIYSVHTACSSEKEASAIARTLLQEKLAACANLFPARSLYWWEGKVVDEKEFFLVVKTTKTMVPKTVKKIEELHSYSIPCIITEEIRTNSTYATWVEGALR